MYIGKKVIGNFKNTTAKKRTEVDRRSKGLNESEIQKQCEDLLNFLQLRYIRIPDALYRYVFSAQSKLPAYLKKLIADFIKGVPDLTVLLKDGRYICVELKTASGKLSQGQKSFQRSVGESNYHVVRSVEGLRDLLERYEVL